MKLWQPQKQTALRLQLRRSKKPNELLRRTDKSSTPNTKTKQWGKKIGKKIIFFQPHPLSSPSRLFRFGRFISWSRPLENVSPPQKNFFKPSATIAIIYGSFTRFTIFPFEFKKLFLCFL